MRLPSVYLNEDCAALAVLVNTGLTAIIRHTEGRLVDGVAGVALQAGVGPLLLLGLSPDILQPVVDLEGSVLVLGVDGVAGAELVRLVVSPAECEDHAAGEENNTDTAQ